MRVKGQLWAPSVPVNEGDGTPMTAAECAELHAKLVAGEMPIEMAPGVLEQLAAMGISEDDLREQILASLRKGLS